jgi:hypothetical protein
MRATRSTALPGSPTNYSDSDVTPSAGPHRKPPGLPVPRSCSGLSPNDLRVPARRAPDQAKQSAPRRARCPFANAERGIDTHDLTSERDHEELIVALVPRHRCRTVAQLDRQVRRPGRGCRRVRHRAVRGPDCHHRAPIEHPQRSRRSPACAPSLLRVAVSTQQGDHGLDRRARWLGARQLRHEHLDVCGFGRADYEDLTPPIESSRQPGSIVVQQRP